MEGREFLASLGAGGLAGMCVDLTLFPLDTIKTRLQSQQGFYNAGGFRGIYAGVPSAALGSFPNAALFFVTYDCTKSVLGLCVSTKQAPIVHMIAASLGEVIPFALVQFPLWEFLKAVWSWKQNRAVDSWQAAVCGAFAGASAAAVTTPLDLAKTRIMLAKTGTTTASGKVLPVLKNIWETQGISGLFSGIVPRVTWISFGGFIFLGTYDKMHKLLL
ncbi:S-adenosylmethionine mitochondrial carrier protein isoform X9 [Chiloscyllium plagiosum]|uniref:S-adenosylmethionine mitochondrial carrier protein isoform X9 n=1 Tax=Chiloscyllium plagiosum TaxID=36176 RepID=UPI001CB7BDAD|nr:S-adenosylmethionine mitochondrial carrier protein isoform X9 [Chiloscyllium plagiosum]